MSNSERIYLQTVSCDIIERKCFVAEQRVQVMVLKELTNVEEAYMFASFLTGKEKLRLDATTLLIKKHLEDPSNPFRRELVEFKVKNQLVSIEEMEVLIKMINKMSEQERAKIEDLFTNHPDGRAIMERLSKKHAEKIIPEMLEKKFAEVTEELTAKKTVEIARMVDEMTLKMASEMAVEIPDETAARIAAKTREELMKKIAITALEEGTDANFVAKITGLPVTVIRKLKKQPN